MSFKYLHFKLRRFYYVALDWLNDNAPVMCWFCKRAIQKKNSEMVQETTGVWRFACRECNEQITKPFTAKMESRK